MSTRARDEVRIRPLLEEAFRSGIDALDVEVPAMTPRRAARPASVLAFAIRLISLGRLVVRRTRADLFRRAVVARAGSRAGGAPFALRLGPGAGGAGLRILSRAGRLVRYRADVRIDCAAARCPGVLALEQIVTRAADAAPPRRIVRVLGRSSFAIARTRSRVVAVALSALGRRVMDAQHAHLLRLVVAARVVAKATSVPLAFRVP